MGVEERLRRGLLRSCVRGLSELFCWTCLKCFASHKAFAFNTDLSCGKKKNRGGRGEACSRQALRRTHLRWGSPARDATGCSLLPLILRPLSVDGGGRIRRETKHNKTKQNKRKTEAEVEKSFLRASTSSSADWLSLSSAISSRQIEKLEWSDWVVGG